MQTNTIFKKMNGIQTPFASNTDEIETGDDASSCKLTVNQDESERIELQRLLPGMQRMFCPILSAFQIE